MDVFASLFVIIAIIISTCFIIYKISIRNFDYWKKRSVPYVKPVPFIGNLLPIMRLKIIMGQYLAELCNQLQTPYFGFFMFNQPILVVRDLHLIKAILVKDFSNFKNRNLLSDEKCDPFVSHMLSFLRNAVWKSLRAKMTPVFSSGKIKGMVELINEAGEDLNIYLKENLHTNCIETKELCSKYSTDVIASCAFGINANSFKYENAEFRLMGREMFAVSISNTFRQMSYFFFHNVVKILKFRFFKESIHTFVSTIFTTTMEERRKTGNKRNDFIDILLQIQGKDNEQFDQKVMVAQAGLFFAAGFETSSATMSFALYELCIHPDIQKKVRAEIKSVIAEHGGFTYEAIQAMEYLHMVICETLRKYPTIPFLDRLCSKDYRVPDSDLVIKKGTAVYIPLFGLHYDPKYFPEPDKFDPERFSEENRSKIPSFAYIPFGEGPRICIGERFALLSIKSGLAHVLKEYELIPNEKTPRPVIFETKTTFLSSNGGLPMTIKRIISNDA